MDDYKLVFERLPGSYTVVRASDYVVINKSDFNLKLINKKKEDVIGISLPDQTYIDDDFSLNVKLGLDKVLETKKSYQTDIKRYDIDNEERYWIIEYVPIFDDAETEVEFIIVASIEITHLVKAGLTLYGK